MHTQKIATCCYCGARTVLQLTARDGHELACASCGAPIHEMKPMKLASKGKYGSDKHKSEGYRGGDKKKKKRKKSGFWKALEEVADVIEDIID